MKTLKTSLLLFCVFFLHGFLFSQNKKNSYDKKLPVQDLKKDLNILKTHLNKVHAGLYTYISKDSLDQVFSEVENSLKEPMTSTEFFNQITPLLKYIRNGHTEIKPASKYVDATQKTLPRLPFKVYWDQNKLFITKNQSLDSTIIDGSEIVKINGLKADEIFLGIVEKQTRDGFNTTYPIIEAYQRFSLYYAYFHGTPAKFELELKEPNGSIISRDVKAITLPEILKITKKRYPKHKKWHDNKGKALKFEVNEGVATITIKTFSWGYYKKTKQNFKKFFNTAFDSIKNNNIQNLVIDLRNNGGGNPEPTIALFSHLYDKPFTFYKEISTITRRIPNPRLYKDFLLLQHIAAPFFLKKDGDKFLLKGVAGLKETKPSESVFKGNLYVLTNANSFSATGEMSSIIKNANIATFIGEETGGNPNQNTSGSMLRLTLPKTKVRVIMPIVLWKMNIDFENTGRGVIPDHHIRPSINDILKKKDVVMEYSLNLIKSNKSVVVK